VVVFLGQGVNAGEDAVGSLEAGTAVVPVYAKERLLGFLPGIKVVSISRICNRDGDFLAIRIERSKARNGLSWCFLPAHS
jgi:hypothetical protein